jgi:hypothetical protein
MFLFFLLFFIDFTLHQESGELGKALSALGMYLFFSPYEQSAVGRKTKKH